MYEYSVEVFDVKKVKLFKQQISSDKFDGFTELINEKAEDGWELVAHMFLGADTYTTSHTIVATFKKELR